MPRRKQPPRLYLDPKRRTWSIRDGATFHRLGLPERDREGAEKQLASYLASKHSPAPSDDPLIVDILNVYAREHVPHIATAKELSYVLQRLGGWWSDKRSSDIGPERCREYARSCSGNGSARRDIATLRAAVRFYAKGANLPRVPSFVLPPKPEPRTRWLTRSEAARFLWAARRIEHLRRFIILGLYTGSRSKNLFGLRWEQIDLEAGVMRRQASGEKQNPTKRAPPVRLGRRILSHLRRWHSREVALQHVIHFNGKPIRKFSMTWGKALAKAGLTGVTPHTLRHTRATWLLQAGIPIWEAAGHLGMSPETLVKVYGHHHPEWQKAASEV